MPMMSCSGGTGASILLVDALSCHPLNRYTRLSLSRVQDLRALLMSAQKRTFLSFPLPSPPLSPYSPPHLLSSPFLSSSFLSFPPLPPSTPLPSYPFFPSSFPSSSLPLSLRGWNLAWVLHLLTKFFTTERYPQSQRKSSSPGLLSAETSPSWRDVCTDRAVKLVAVGGWILYNFAPQKPILLCA